MRPHTSAFDHHRTPLRFVSTLPPLQQDQQQQHQSGSLHDEERSGARYHDPQEVTQLSPDPMAPRYSIPPLGSHGLWSKRPKLISTPSTSSTTTTGKSIHGDAGLSPDPQIEDDRDVSSQFASPPSFMKPTMSAQRSSTGNTSSMSSGNNVKVNFHSSAHAAEGVSPIAFAQHDDDETAKIGDASHIAHNDGDHSTFLAPDDMDFARLAGGHGGEDRLELISDTVAHLPSSYAQTPDPAHRRRRDIGGGSAMGSKTAAATPPPPSSFMDSLPSPGVGGFTTSSHVKELASKYFSMVRQSQQEEAERADVVVIGSNPTLATPSRRPTSESSAANLRTPAGNSIPSAAAAASFSPAPRVPTTNGIFHHPQHHLISREFELCSDALVYATDDNNKSNSKKFNEDLDDASSLTKQQAFLVKECYVRRRLVSANRTGSDDISVSDDTSTDASSSSPNASDGTPLAKGRHQFNPSSTKKKNATCLTFAGQAEISSLVNMGDVALCRLIDIRTQFSAEREHHAHFLRATTATCNTLPLQIQLSMPTRTALRNAIHERQQKRQHDDDENAKPDRNTYASEEHLEEGSVALEEKLAAIEAMIHSYYSHNMNDTSVAEDIDSADDHRTNSQLLQVSLQSVFDLRNGYRSVMHKSSSSSSSGAPPHAISSLLELQQCLHAVLDSLLAEVAAVSAESSGQQQQQQTPAKKQQHPVADNGSFDFDMAMDDVQTHQAQEEAHKHAGNLSLGAAARRELLQILHKYIAHCCEAVESASSGKHSSAALDAARALTDRILREQQSKLSTMVISEQARIAKCKDMTKTCDATVAALQSRKNAAIVEQHQFLVDNDALIQSTLRKIDELYGTLEDCINKRSTKLKSYSTDLATLACNEFEAEELAKSATAALQTALQTTLSTTQQRNAEAMVSAVLPAVLTAARSTQASALEQQKFELQNRQASLQDCGVRLAVLQRNSVSQWVDVLLRNQQREEERAQSLQLQIRDAASRYHQEDVDLFRGQYDDTMERRKKIDSEISQLEEMMRSDEKLLSMHVPNFPSHLAVAMQTQNQYHSQSQHQYYDASFTANTSYYSQPHQQMYQQNTGGGGGMSRPHSSSGNVPTTTSAGVWQGTPSRSPPRRSQRLGAAQYLAQGESPAGMGYQPQHYGMQSPAPMYHQTAGALHVDPMSPMPNHIHHQTQGLPQQQQQQYYPQQQPHQSMMVHNTSVASSMKTPLKQTMAQTSAMYDFVQSPATQPQQQHHNIVPTGTSAKKQPSQQHQPFSPLPVYPTPSAAPTQQHAHQRQHQNIVPSMSLVLVDEDDHHMPARRRARAEARPAREISIQEQQVAFDHSQFPRARSYGSDVIETAADDDDDEVAQLHEQENDVAMSIPGEEDDADGDDRMIQNNFASVRRVRARAVSPIANTTRSPNDDDDEFGRNWPRERDYSPMKRPEGDNDSSEGASPAPRCDSPEPRRMTAAMFSTVDPPSPVPQRSQSLRRCESDRSSKSAVLPASTLPPLSPPEFSMHPVTQSSTGVFSQQQQQQYALSPMPSSPTPRDPNAFEAAPGFAWHNRTISGNSQVLATDDFDDDEDDDGTELVDVDELTVEDVVTLFRRSPTMSAKWVAILHDADVETMKDIRVLHMSSSVWAAFLQHHPLLKSMLETLMENPRHFVSNDE